MDLIRKGASMAGFLCPRKARILLWLLVGCQRKMNWRVISQQTDTAL